MRAAHLSDDELGALAFDADAASDAARAHHASCATCSARVASASEAFAAIEVVPSTDTRALALGTQVHARVRGDETLGRRRAWIALAAAAIAACALVASRLLGADPPFVSPAHGALSCGATEVTGGALGIAVAIAFARRRVTHLDALRGSAVGALGASVTQLYVHLRCPEHAMVHLFFGHLLAVGIAAILGAIVTPRATGPRSI